MPLVSSTIPNLISGVSQQAPSLRLASQCEDQDNFYPSVVEGLKKRSATTYLAKLFTGTLGAAYVGTINRDATERYIVTITNGDLKVHKIDGTPVTVTFPDGTGYLTATDPTDSFEMVTVADYTFIINKGVTVAMDSSSTSPDRGVEAIVFIKQADYEVDYSIDINGTTEAAYTTGASGAVKTTDIAADLAADLTTNLGTGWTITQQQSTIHIAKTDGTDFTISVEDSVANTYMRIAKDQVQKFTDLPTIAPTDFVVEVVGDQSSNFDNYFVKFVPNNDGATFDEGVWNETVKPGIEWEFDASTMPHALIRQSSGDFTFEELDWGAREVGDEYSAPLPTFVGETLSDIFFFENRLAVLAGENAIFSRSGEFFEFFPTTVTTLVDSDPVDTAASHTKVSYLRYAIPYDQEVLFFSDQTQFTLNVQDTLTPTNAPIKVLTSFDSNNTARPVSAGKSVFFAAARGSYTSIKEFFVIPDTLARDAADITSHVPKYIPSGVIKLASSQNEDVLVVLSEDEPTKLYVYKYMWLNNEKLQSAWGSFSFEGSILNVDFIESTLYIVAQYSDGVYLMSMNLSPGYTDTGEDFEYRLDRKITEDDCTVTYDSVADETTFVVPYVIDGTMIVVTRGTASPPGIVLQKVSQSSNQVVVSGDYSTTEVFLGETYTATYQPSPFTLKESTGKTGKALVSEGRLQIRYNRLAYDDTGYFKVSVTPDYRDTSEYVFTGRILGAGSNVLGAIPISSGTFKFPIFSKNDQVTVVITNDSYLPSTFLSNEIEAFYHIRSKRL